MSRRRISLAVALAVLASLAVAGPALAAPPPGSVLWTNTFGTTPTTDDFIDASRCPDGGVVAVGITNYDELVPGSMDGLVCKYSAGGTLQWSRAFDNGDALDDMFISVAVDRTGNIYAGGSADSPLTGNDYLVVKYDNNGNRKWAMPVDGGRSVDDGFRGLALDAAGNPCATGWAGLAPSGSQLFTVRLRPADGDVTARARYNGPAGAKYVDASGIALGDHGSLLVAGYVVNGTSIERALAVKLSATMHTKWARTYSPAGSTDTSAEAMQKGPNGTSFVLATTDRGSAGSDVLLLKYSKTGARRFVKRYDSGAGTGDRADDLVVDGSGNVFTTGRAPSKDGTRSHAFVIRWSAAGARRWVRDYPSTGVTASEYRDVLPDQKGGVYLAGQLTFTASGDVNGFVRHVRSAGSLAWSRISVHTPGGDSFEALAFCGGNGICAVGRYLYSPAPADQDAIIQKRQK